MKAATLIADQVSILEDAAFFILIIFSLLAAYKVSAQLSIAKELVLPVRIELTTSPLPRECSTTELRQQRPDPEKWKPVFGKDHA